MNMNSTPKTETVLHLGHHPQPGGGFRDLILRVKGRTEHTGSQCNPVALIDSPKCSRRATQELESHVTGVEVFGTGPVDIHLLPIHLGKILPGVREVYQLTKEHEVDILHANSFRAALIGAFVSQLQGLPFIMHVHHPSSLTTHPYLQRYLFTTANRVIHVSKYTKSIFGRDDTTHKVIRSPIAIDELLGSDGNPDTLKSTFSLNEGQTVALIGRLAPNKGHRKFVQAATELATDYPDVNFLIVGGDGKPGYREELETLVSSLGISDRITFTGFWEDIVGVYQLADIVVVPSTDENLPKTIQEALAFKCTVIASDSGGIPELVIDRETGRTVPAESDGTQFATVIDEILSAPNVADQLAESGHERLRGEFSLPVVTEELEAMYRAVGQTN